MAEHARLRKHVLDHLESFPLLGKGVFGKVFQASGPKKEKYALKISSMTGASKKEEGYLLSEVTTLARFVHPHIVKYVSGWEEYDRRGDLHVYLLMEYCEGKDLRSYLTNKGAPTGDTQFGCWLAQIASGLHHVHSKDVLHRNLKTSNILVTTAGRETVLKIGDFGMARILEHPGAMAASIVGTPYFMSPEALCGNSYNNKTDIWSFGCTAFEIATLKTIFQAQNMRSLVSGVKKGLEKVLEDNIKYSSFFISLLGDTLNTEAQNRPSAYEILQRLESKGYKSMHREDFGSCVSSTTSSERSRSYSSSSTLTPVPEQEQVTPEHGCSVSNKPEGQNATPTPSRNRSHSESDMALALKKFTISQRQKTPPIENQTPRVDSVDVGSSGEDTRTTSVSGLTSATRSGHSSGSGYETDISNSGSSTMYSRISIPDTSDTDDENQEQRTDPTMAKSMKIIGNIKKYQTKIAQTIGEDKFRVAYEILGKEDDNIMVSALEETLGGDFEEVGPTLIYLRLLERKLDSLEQKRTLTGGKFNQTM